MHATVSPRYVPLTMPETILIIGAGAVGCTVAAALADAGHTPAFAVRKPFAQLERHFDGTVDRYQCVQFTCAEQLGEYDWILLCTKSYHTEAALDWLRLPLAATTTLAVLQNGVDHIERLGTHVPREQVLPVIVRMACEKQAPGIAVQPRHGALYVPDTQRGQRFAALFCDHRAVTARTASNFVSMLWQKLALNAVNATAELGVGRT